MLSLRAIVSAQPRGPISNDGGKSSDAWRSFECRDEPRVRAFRCDIKSSRGHGGPRGTFLEGRTWDHLQLLGVARALIRRLVILFRSSPMHWTARSPPRPFRARQGEYSWGTVPGTASWCSDSWRFETSRPARQSTAGSTHGPRRRWRTCSPALWMILSLATLGEWHSHPGPVRSSRQDVGELRRTSQGTAHPIALVVLRREEDSWACDSWIAHGRRSCRAQLVEISNVGEGKGADGNGRA
jgi:hypothetical protein